MSDFKIGTTAGTLVALDHLTTALPDPQWEFREFRKTVRLGDNSVRGLGPQTVVWTFPLLTTAQIAQLESFKGNESIFVQTAKRDDTFAVFEVLYNWTDPRQDGAHKAGFRGHRFGLELELIVLAEVA